MKTSYHRICIGTLPDGPNWTIFPVLPMRSPKYQVHLFLPRMMWNRIDMIFVACRWLDLPEVDLILGEHKNGILYTSISGWGCRNAAAVRCTNPNLNFAPNGHNELSCAQDTM